MFCDVAVVKLAIIFLKNAYERVYPEKLFKKKGAFSESLQQLVINKRNV